MSVTFLRKNRWELKLYIWQIGRPWRAAGPKFISIAMAPVWLPWNCKIIVKKSFLDQTWYEGQGPFRFRT